jgi:LysR family hydrogen peroxide-inducible transcriptional activator
MTLQQIRYALAVEEELSFVKAAEKCHVAQPSLSVQIKNLESELGITIFDRSGKTQVRMTPAGQVLLSRFKTVLIDLQKAVDDVKSYQTSPFGTLKVGIIPTICPYIMPHILKYKNKFYPNINFEINEDTTDNLLKLINNGQLDCGLLSTPLKTPKDLIEQFLYYEPFVLYAAADHPLLEKERVSTFDLAKFEVSMLDETHCMRDQVLAACKFKNKEKKIQQSKLVSGSLQTLISIVDETKSFSLIPSMAAEYLHFKHPKSGIRKITSPTPKRKVSLVYNKHYERKNLLSALVKSVCNGLPDSFTEPVIGSATAVMYPDKKRFDAN